MKLNTQEQELHNRAISLGQQHRRNEADLVEVVLEVKNSLILKKLDVNNIFIYAVKYMKLSRSTGYALKAISKRCEEIPVFHAAIKNLRISLSTATRLLSALNSENAAALIDFAENATARELEIHLATLRPRAIPKTKITFVTKNIAKYTTCFDLKVLAKHERCKSLEAQRGRHEDLQEKLYDVYLEKYDPVQKAQRAEKRKEAQKEPAAPKKSGRPERVRITNAQRHVVTLRDGGRCVHVHEDGIRCGQDRYVDIHHVIPVSEGGTNDPANLETLCGFHHDLRHQTSFIFEESERPDEHPPLG